MSFQLQSLQSFIKANPFLTTAATATLTLAIIAYRDYRAYVALGPHGLPDTFWGWYRQLSMTGKARRDTTVPAPYDFDTVAGPHDKTSYLPTSAAQGLSWRPGNKAPKVANFVAPQRQTSDLATDAMKGKMFEYLDEIAAKTPNILQTRLSILEGPIPSLGVKDFAALKDKPDIFRVTRGEMCHIHPPDGSTHLTLSLTDQKLLIELGWARRHPLSGVILPWGYTFLYAPRNEKEFETWKRVVNASVKFCCADIGEVRV